MKVDDYNNIYKYNTIIGTYAVTRTECRRGDVEYLKTEVKNSKTQIAITVAVLTKYQI